MSIIYGKNANAQKWGDMHYRDSNEQITIVHILFRNWKRTNGLSESYDFQNLVCNNKNKNKNINIKRS